MDGPGAAPLANRGRAFGTIAGRVCVTKKKRAQIWARFLGKGRKPEWPALILVDLQVISTAGSGPADLARGVAGPSHGVQGQGSTQARPYSDRRKTHTVTASVPEAE